MAQTPADIDITTPDGARIVIWDATQMAPVVNVAIANLIDTIASTIKKDDDQCGSSHS